MLKSEAHVGMQVLFGRGKGEKTLAEITKINRKNFKVRQLEIRGQKKTYRVGTVWTVPPSLCKPAPNAEPKKTRPVADRPVASHKTTTRRTSSRKSQVSSRYKGLAKEFRAKKAVESADESEASLRNGCDLSNPPTYIKHSRRYLDGTTIRKRGTEYDGQRQKLYDAERCCTRGKEFKTFRQAERYFEKILDSAWFNRRFDRPSVTLKEGSGNGSAYWWGSDTIRLSTKNHLCERILIHELIHTLVPLPHSGHGRLFCSIYLDFVRHYMGEDAYDQLLKGYRKHNVKYQPHRSAKR